MTAECPEPAARAATPELPVPFFDPQVNGYGGIDFQDDQLTIDGLLSAVRAWRRDGGTFFLLTLITDEWQRLIARLHRLRELSEVHPELRSAIAGWHVEGPFLSDQPGFCGAHDPALMVDPAPWHMDELRAAAGGDPLVLTLAPERTGAARAIEAAVARGIRVSLGHTNASAAELRDALSAGATAFTHLGNGCPQLLDRHDNILWRVLDTPGLVIGLIADGLHVSGPVFRLIHRVVPPECLYYTTDAMAAAGAPPGTYPLGRLRLAVGTDGVVRQPGRDNFAGSSLRPSQLPGRVARLAGENAPRWLRATAETARRWVLPETARD